MGLGPDLKPLFEKLDRMTNAFDRLAAAIEEQNEIARETNASRR